MHNTISLKCEELCRIDLNLSNLHLNLEFYNSRINVLVLRLAVPPQYAEETVYQVTTLVHYSVMHRIQAHSNKWPVSLWALEILNLNMTLWEHRVARVVKLVETVLVEILMRGVEVLVLSSNLILTVNKKYQHSSRLIREKRRKQRHRLHQSRRKM